MRHFFANIFKIFRVSKKPIFLVVIISLVIGLIAGTFSAIYIAPFLNERLNLTTQQPDLFLETFSGDEKEDHSDTVQPQIAKGIPDVVEEVSPAVVSVIVSKYVPVLEKYYYNPFEEFEEFFGRDFGFQIPQYRQKGKELQEVGGGTGFIVSSDGLVVTNKHVVYDEDAEYTVLTNEGEKYPAPVLARDPVQDIAILKISADNLPTVKLGNSDSLRIGQTVITIGNALGEFRNTVSVGVISGLARSITASGGGMLEQLEEVIQTDAAINQGNSGGPLLNLYGEVIGINTAMALEAENIGFAIPINKVKKDVQDIQTKGRICYPFLGVRYVLIDKTIQEKNNLSVDYGALVIRGDDPSEPAVMPGSAADRSGIVENDIILEIDGVKINQENTLTKLILKHDIGDKVILKVLHRGEEKILEAELGEWK
jgi:serine protease Do